LSNRMALSLYGLISDSEKKFIVGGINEDMRSDGRNCSDFRVIEMETDCIATTNGSARIRLGSTELLVGVKAELEKPSITEPEQGRVEFNVDCSPNATPMFEGRRGGEEIEAEMAALFTRFFDQSEVCDLKALSVVPAAWCWAIYIDILILEVGGNLIDASSLAIKAALKSTMLPKLTIEKGDENDFEISLTDDPLDGDLLKVQPALTVTIAKLGYRYVVDPTDEEEAVANANLVVSVKEDGEVGGVKKIGTGSLDPESIREMISLAKKAGKTLHRSLKRYLESNENFGTEEDSRRL